MLPAAFQAVWRDEESIGLKKIGAADLPDGALLIRVAYSSMNYKAALACSGSPGVVK